MTALCARLPVRLRRRRQAVPLVTYTPPSRLILSIRWLVQLKPEELLGGVFLVIVAAHLLWTVVPR